MAVERCFRAMGTDATVTVVGREALAESAIDRIAELEARWSRFQPTSEVSALNRANGSPVRVSPDTRRLAQTAIDAWNSSAGFVDCTLLDDLLAVGYDRSLDTLPGDRHAPASSRPRIASLLGPCDIHIDGDAVALPLGLKFDPGGIGKGLAADIVTEEIMATGAEGVCVNLGGDLRVRGTNPDGRAWTISIDHPGRDSPLALIGVTDGAVATSTTLLRNWRVDGELFHHLLDPRTGQPADSGIEFATAVAGSAFQAETMAKAVLIRGGRTPFDIVEGTGIEVLIVDDHGTVTTSRGFGRFTGGTSPGAIPEVSP